MKRILGINPGSTSTKFAVFEDMTPVWHLYIRHSVEELSKFPTVMDQFEYRRDLILKALNDAGIKLDFDAVVGRGGLTKPIPGGVYEVNEEMIDDLRHAHRDHACNLGSLLAHDIAKNIPGCKAMMADPGVVDELMDVARITGSPMMNRMTTWHALNQRAIARRFAREMAEKNPDGPNKKYEEMDLIVLHLGGGISIGAHHGGKCIDVNNAFDGEGPFSPERAGSLPPGMLIDLCYSGKYTHDELRKRISGKAGLAAHLGTVNCIEIEDRIAHGDEKAKGVYDAMIYQIAKNAASLTPAFKDGKVDAILITGGVAHSDYVCDGLKERLHHIAPIYLYPGEDEITALVHNSLGALTGEFPLQTYHHN